MYYAKIRNHVAFITVFLWAVLVLAGSQVETYFNSIRIMAKSACSETCPRAKRTTSIDLSDYITSLPPWGFLLHHRKWLSIAERAEIIRTKFCQYSTWTRTVQKQALGIKHDPISRCRQKIGDITGSFQPTKLKETFVGAHGLSNQFRTFSFTRCFNDDRLSGKGVVRRAAWYRRKETQTCFSWMAWSTRNAARSAVCCATLKVEQWDGVS